MDINIDKVFIHISKLIFCLFLCFSTQVQASKVADVQLKETIKLGDTHLLLNGAGIRSKLFIDLYIAALYLNNKTQDPQSIITADEPMMIQIHVISNLISSENLTRGTSEGFAKSTGNKTEAIQTQIDDFLDSFKEPIKINDIFEIVYIPNKGITVIKNRHIVKKLNVDMAFKQALFGIWLSDNPAQKSLKDKMLGK
jgi:hypothetical protein